MVNLKISEARTKAIRIDILLKYFLDDCCFFQTKYRQREECKFKKDKNQSQVCINRV